MLLPHQFLNFCLWPFHLEAVQIVHSNVGRVGRIVETEYIINALHIFLQMLRGRRRKCYENDVCVIV